MSRLLAILLIGALAAGLWVADSPAGVVAAILLMSGGLVALQTAIGLWGAIAVLPYHGGHWLEPPILALSAVLGKA